MGAAAFIGRVGSLAVALGVGAALATGQGVAVADSSSDSSTGSASTDSRDSGTSPSSEPSDDGSSGEAADHGPVGFDDADELETDEDEQEDEQEDEDDADESETDASEEAAEGDPVGFDGGDAPAEDESNGPARRPETTGSDDAPVEPPIATALAETARTSAARTNSEPPVDTEPAQPPAAPLEAPQSPESSPEPGGWSDATVAFSAAAAPTSAAAAVGALSTLPATFLRVASNLITVALTPFLGPGPDAPAQPPLLWAVLAWVRREIQHTFFNARPTVAYVAEDNEQDGAGVVTGDLKIDDREQDPVRITVVDGPGGGTVEVAADGTFRYVPGAALASAGGTDTFVVRLDDSGFHLHGLAGLLGGGHTTTATIEVTVAPVNNPPEGGEVIDVVTDPESGSVSGRIVVDDPNGDTLTYSGPTTSANGGTVDVAEDGTFTYVPTQEARHAAARAENPVTTDTFEVSAEDGRDGVTTVTVTVPVTPVNSPPQADIDVYEAADGRATITIVVRDDDGDPVHIVISEPERGTIVDLPEDGVIVIEGAGTVTLHYVRTPSADPGPDPITVQIDDGHQGTLTFSLRIDASYSSPVITEIHTETSDPTTGVISGNVTVADGDGVTFSVSDPSHGAAEIDDEGNFVYTPDLSYFSNKPSGTTDTFAVTVTNRYGQTTSWTLTYTWAPTITGLQANDDRREIAEQRKIGWAISPDGTLLYVSDGEPYINIPDGVTQNIRVFQIVVDAAGHRTYTELDSLRVAGIIANHVTAISPDGDYLYVQMIEEPGQQPYEQPAVIRRIDVATGEYSPAFGVTIDSKFIDMAVSPDGTKLYGTNLSEDIIAVDLATGEATVINETGPTYIALSPDGTTLYHVNGTMLVATDLNTLQSRELSRAPKRPLVVSPDGTRIYVFNGSIYAITVIDSDSGAVLDTVEMDNFGDDLLIGADGTLYVINAVFGSVQTFSPELAPNGTITAPSVQTTPLT